MTHPNREAIDFLKLVREQIAAGDELAAALAVVHSQAHKPTDGGPCEACGPAVNALLNTIRPDSPVAHPEGSSNGKADTISAVRTSIGLQVVDRAIGILLDEKSATPETALPREALAGHGMSTAEALAHLGLTPTQAPGIA